MSCCCSAGNRESGIRNRKGDAPRRFVMPAKGVVIPSAARNLFVDAQQIPRCAWNDRKHVAHVRRQSGYTRFSIPDSRFQAPTGARA